jgi:predicted nucleic acid-binding protein
MDEPLSLYLDVCCLNRPFDDQEQDRVRLEAEAVRIIIHEFRMGRWTLACSDVLLLEIRQTPDEERRNNLIEILDLCRTTVTAGQPQRDRAVYFQSFGLRPLDALHLACAESGGAKAFLTTDDRLLRGCQRNSERLHVKVHNPIQWLQEVETHG